MHFLLFPVYHFRFAFIKIIFEMAFLRKGKKANTCLATFGGLRRKAPNPPYDFLSILIAEQHAATGANEYRCTLLGPNSCNALT